MLLTLKHWLTNLTHVPMWGVLQVIGFIVILTFAFISRRIGSQGLAELQEVKAQVGQLQDEYKTLAETLEVRVNALETITYVDIIQEMQKNKIVPFVFENWRQNRDAEFNKRLESLERFRYRVDPELR